MATTENPGRELVERIESQFADKSSPATVRMVADLYGSLALATDLMVDIISMAAKSNPRVIREPEWADMQQSLRILADNIAAKLTALEGPEVSDETQD